MSNITLYTDLGKALDALSKNRKTHQIIGYKLQDGVSTTPVFAYIYLGNDLKKLET